MENDVRTAEVLSLTGVSKPTLYRWMDKHPTLSVATEQSSLGHPFPKPSGKEGREVIWNDDAVKSWWADNRGSVGRHPSDDLCFATMDWKRFRAAMLTPPEVYEEKGQEVVDDHMDGLLRFERDGDKARLWFRNADDKVMFVLTYS